jgi:hypothetical protein
VAVKPVWVEDSEIGGMVEKIWWSSEERVFRRSRVMLGAEGNSGNRPKTIERGDKAFLGRRRFPSILLGRIDDARDDLNLSGCLGLRGRWEFFVTCGIDLIVVPLELRYVPAWGGVL